MPPSRGAPANPPTASPTDTVAEIRTPRNDGRDGLESTVASTLSFWEL